MKRTSMYTAVLALSLAMALAGGGLACRTFRERLDALEEQAVLQHQRNVCGLEDAFAAEYDTRSGAGYPSSGADSVCARVGQAYTRGQWLILGSSTAAFALMREGDVAYSALPESVAAADVQQAAAATDGILLRGETLLLGGVLNTPYSYPVAVVTAADASEAFAARNRLLYSWLAVQAVITLAALVAAYHYERLQELNARQSRFVADLTHELKTPLQSIIGSVELLGGEIAEDIASYFVESEQIPTACGLGVLVDRDRSVLRAGGYLIQLLPGAPEGIIDRLEKGIMEAGPVTKLLLDNDDPESLLRRVMSGFELEILEKTPVEYRCYCSRERVTRALISMGREELNSLIREQGRAELTCQFCDKVYHYTNEELEGLLASL